MSKLLVIVNNHFQGGMRTYGELVIRALQEQTEIQWYAVYPRYSMESTKFSPIGSDCPEGCVNLTAEYEMKVMVDWCDTILTIAHGPADGLGHISDEVLDSKRMILIMHSTADAERWRREHYKTEAALLRPQYEYVMYREQLIGDLEKVARNLDCPSINAREMRVHHIGLPS